MTTPELPRHGDPPAEARPADGQVFQTFFAQSREDIHAILLRLDELRVLLDIRDQSVAVSAHAEEVGLFFHELQRQASAWILESARFCFCVTNKDLFSLVIPAYRDRYTVRSCSLSLT